MGEGFLDATMVIDDMAANELEAEAKSNLVLRSPTPILGGNCLNMLGKAEDKGEQQPHQLGSD